MVDKNIIVIVATVLLIIVLLVLRKLIINYKIKKDFNYITDGNKGELSERELVYKLLKLKHKKEYIFHDVYVQKNNGDYSQLDVVLLSKSGVISIEVKDYAGVVYGHAESDKWVQKKSFFNKREFYNPIKQNYGHITALKQNIRKLPLSCGIDSIPFYNMIVFYGSSRIRRIRGLNKFTYVIKPFWLRFTLWKIKKRSLKYNFNISNSDLSKISTMLRNAYIENDTEEVRSTHLEMVKQYQKIPLCRRILRKLLNFIKGLFIKR